MGQDAVICIQCGYDQRSGLQFSGKPLVPGGRSRVMLIVGIVILAGLVWSLMRPTEEPVEIVELSSDQPSDTVAQADGRDASPVASSAPQAPESAVVDGSSSTVQTATAEASPTSEAATEERQAMEERIRAQLAGQIKMSYPVYTNGEHVALRRVNGMIHRGTYLGVNSNAVVILVGRDPMRVPLAVLDTSTRLRSDSDSRAKFIDYHVKKRLGDGLAP